MFCFLTGFLSWIDYLKLRLIVERHLNHVFKKILKSSHIINEFLLFIFIIKKELDISTCK